uniref:beta-sandwich lipoprotein n=1 Tax=Enterobacter cancerogenus TaxID=69218 RepID=UPI001F298530|nr:hypothetical protein [Enterobacter cancerogenus]
MVKKIMLLFVVMLLAACDVNDADVASRNVGKAAENFEAQRRFVFYKGITGEFMLEITDLCSKDNTSTVRTLGVTCKTGPNTFKKHLLGL